MEFLVSVKNDRSVFVKELLGNLKGVKATALTIANKQLLAEMEEAVNELRLIRAGKKKGRPVQELLNEL